MSERERANEHDEPRTPWLSQLALEAFVDPMVPKGYIEIRDDDGLLARRQWIGPDRASSVAPPANE